MPKISSFAYKLFELQIIFLLFPIELQSLDKIGCQKINNLKIRFFLGGILLLQASCHAENNVNIELIKYCGVFWFLFVLKGQKDRK